MSYSNEFWLVSAPGEKTPQQTWETLNNATAKQSGLSQNFKFTIPDLKVGTLDVLVGLSDELAKLDVYTESVTRKVAQYLSDVLEDEKDKIQESLQAGNKDLVSYLTKFEWDTAKYPIKQSLKTISEIIAKQISLIDGDLKTKSQAYNNLKGNLQNLEKKNTGSLLTRTLTDLVKKEDFVLDSEYLVTLVVVVPKVNYKDWYNKYESLANFVVPRSSKLLYEDNELGLFNVTIFKKTLDEYKTHCRENRFTVREFEYNEEALAAGKNELSKLVSDKQKQFGPLVKWLKVNFSEAFMAWMHVKALRAFVESVLRYGLPVTFQAMLLRPQRKGGKRLLEELNKLYRHLDVSLGGTSASDVVDIPGLSVGTADYYPFVFL